jgi:hypothetical protein
MGVRGHPSSGDSSVLERCLGWTAASGMLSVSGMSGPEMALGARGGKLTPSPFSCQGADIILGIMRSSIDYLDPGVNEEGGPVDCGREGLLGVDHDGDFAVEIDGDGEVGGFVAGDEVAGGDGVAALMFYGVSYGNALAEGAVAFAVEEIGILFL